MQHAAAAKCHGIPSTIFVRRIFVPPLATRYAGFREAGSIVLGVKNDGRLAAPIGINP
jgi:hypothetical protein